MYIWSNEFCLQVLLLRNIRMGYREGNQIRLINMYATKDTVP